MWWLVPSPEVLGIGGSYTYHLEHVTSWSLGGWQWQQFKTASVVWDGEQVVAEAQNQAEACGMQMAVAMPMTPPGARVGHVILPESMHSRKGCSGVSHHAPHTARPSIAPGL